MQLKRAGCRLQDAGFSAGRSLLFAFCAIFLSTVSSAQCAMCRAALEGEGNAAKADAVNNGIVYLMVIPYLLVGGIGYLIYRMRKGKVI